MRGEPDLTIGTITENQDTEELRAGTKINNVKSLGKDLQEPSIKRWGICDAKAIIHMKGYIEDERT